MNNTSPVAAPFCWPKSAPTQESPTVAKDPAPPAVRSVRAKLKTVADCSHQLAVIFREARSGKLDIGDASKLANILALLARTLSDSEIEARLEALEQRGY